MRTFLVVALGIIAAGAAAIALNLVLLGYSPPPGEPVGKLSPALPLKVGPKPPPVIAPGPARGGERDD